MQSALTHRMIAAGLETGRGGGVGVGQGGALGPARAPGPGKAEAAPSTSKAVAQSFLLNFKSSLTNAGEEVGIDADAESSEAPGGSSPFNSPAKAVDISSNHFSPTVAAPPMANLASSKGAPKKQTLGTSGKQDASGLGMAQSLPRGHPSTDQANKNEHGSNGVRSARESSSGRSQKNGTQEPNAASALTATSTTTVSITDLVAPLTGLVSPRHDAPPSPEIEGRTKSASRVLGASLNIGDVPAAGAIQHTTSIRSVSVEAKQAQPLETQPSVASQTEVAEDSASDHASVRAAAHGTVSTSIQPMIQGAQAAAILTPKRNEAGAAAPAAAVGSSNIQSPIAPGGRASAEPVPRSEHQGSLQPAAHSTDTATEHANPSVQVHLGFNMAQNPSPAMQAAAAGGGSVKPDAASVSAGNATMGAHDPFVALDAETGAVAPTWIHAGAYQAEAGFQDPALGWIGVRAQADTTGVHAALVPGSADAAQALSGHLPGLNDYLQHRESSVQTVIMSSPESHSAGSGTDLGTGQGGGQEASSGGYSGRQADAEYGDLSIGPMARRETAPTVSAPDVLPMGTVPGGVYISVMV